VAPSLGLVGGDGELPVLIGREARRSGWRVVAFALGEGGADLRAAADRVVACGPGDVGPILAVLAEEGIRQVVLAGRVGKDGLFRGGIRLDGAAQGLLERSPDWTDDGLLRTATKALSTLGIEVLDQRRFVAPLMAPLGPVAGPPPAAATAVDIGLGLRVARDVARHGIGQTVVVRAGTVVAVEAMEGTDEAICRGLRLGGPGAVVVKATRPGHDYRFDVPAIGEATLRLCVEGRAVALAVEAGRVALLQREAIETAAAESGLSVVGVAGDADWR
jgi:DUF1009 family protein